MRTEADVMDSMKEHFGGVSDPRVPGRTLYPLMEVLVMAFVGVLCGGDDWDEIAAIAEEHESWLRRFRRQERRVTPLEQATKNHKHETHHPHRSAWLRHVRREPRRRTVSGAAGAKANSLE